MQANLETLSPLERRLHVAVPLNEIDSEIQTRLKRLTRTVKMRGFRPGKVPLKVVVQQFGAQVRQEVLGDTLQKSFGDAVRQQNLRVAGYPRFEAKPVAEGASEFEYSATFEVYPEVKLGDLSAATIVRPALEVGEAEVDKTVEIMRKQRTTYEPVERAAADGDQLVIDYRGTVDGEEFTGSSAKDHVVILGGDRLLPEFEKHLIGLKAGETRQFELRFPDDYHGKEVAGKIAAFEVKVSRVAGPRLPAVDAEFAKRLGVADGDIGKMRAEIKANLGREVRLRIKGRVKEQVMQALLEANPVDLPKSLVQLETQHLAGRARHDLAARGIALKDGTALPRELLEKQARRRVHLGLVFAELVKAHDLHAKPEQVRAAVEEQAQSYEHPDEVVKWYFQSPERLREIESVVLEDNVVNWVSSVAKMQERTFTFDELMESK